MTRTTVSNNFLSGLALLMTTLAFAASRIKDAEWLAIRKSTEENGPLIFDIESSLLRPTNFSAAK
jgi:hypothetical protein